MTEPSDTADTLLSRQLLQTFPEEAARALEALPADEVAQLLADEAPDTGAALLRAMVTPFARSVITEMATPNAAAIVGAMPIPWAASRLRTMPAPRIDQLIELLPPTVGSALRRALHYSPQTIGSLMDPTAFCLAPDATATAALDQIRERSDSEIEGVHVVTRAGKLVGTARVAAIVAADPGKLLSEVADASIPTLDADSDARALASHPGWAEWRTLPVVDREAGFQGAVSYHAIQHLLLEVPTGRVSAISLPLSLIELYWVGLVGMTDGLARTVAPKGASDEG